MSIKFTKATRVPKFGTRKDQTLHYAKQEKSPRVTLKAVEDDIVRTTSLARGDVRNAITSLTEIVNSYLAQGFAVDLGDLGSFRVVASSQAVETKEKVNSKLIRRVVVKHTPKGEMAKAVKSVTLEVLGENDGNSNTTETAKPSQPTTPNTSNTPRGNSGL